MKTKRELIENQNQINLNNPIVLLEVLIDIRDVLLDINQNLSKHEITEEKIKEKVTYQFCITGSPIEAIKKYRELTGTGLKEAKAYCKELGIIK